MMRQKASVEAGLNTFVRNFFPRRQLPLLCEQRRGVILIGFTEIVLLDLHSGLWLTSGKPTGICRCRILSRKVLTELRISNNGIGVNPQWLPLRERIVSAE